MRLSGRQDQFLGPYKLKKDKAKETPGSIIWVINAGKAASDHKRINMSFPNQGKAHRE